MGSSQRATSWPWWFLILTALVLLVTHTLASPFPSTSLKAGTGAPKKIEPPSPKFKTSPDEDAAPELDLNVLARDNLSYYDDQDMVIATTRFMPGIYQARIPVGNGYFGTQLAAAGPFFEKDVNQTNRDGNVTEGWPLFNDRQTFATVSGFFDVQETTPRTNFAPLAAMGWESVISGIPYPFALNLVVGESVLDSTVDRETISEFTQSWRLQDGFTQWNYVWAPKNTKVSFVIEYAVFSSRDKPNVGATQLRVTPRVGHSTASIIDLLDGRSAQRSHLVEKGMRSDARQIYVGVHPEGLPKVTAYITSTVNVSNGYTVDASRRMVSFENSMSIGQEWDVQLVEGETAVFQKFIGIASSDKFLSPANTAETSSSASAQEGWDKTLLESTKVWNDLMSRNLIADYRDPSTGELPKNPPFIEKLQAAAVVDRYIILNNLVPEDRNGFNDAGVSPVGLHSDSYGGMIFWDQDTWIFPAIAATSPEYGIQIPKSRVKLWEQAKDNAQASYVKNDIPRYDFDDDSALYPWMTGRYGNATATGPAKDYQYHLNTDIALSMLQARRISGNETLFREEFWPVIRSVAHAMTTLLQEDGDGWSVFNATDPDEYAAAVDNPAYLLSSISSILHQTTLLQEKYGESVNQTWIDMANNMNIPRNLTSGITREYEGMRNDITVKQADVSLISYPWHFAKNYSLEQKRRDLDYYTQKQNPDGPAMTFAINTIVENLFAVTGCSMSTYLQKATIPYLRAPFFLMSEVPNDDVNGNGGVPPAFPFVTGHGGAAQIPLFGYLGLDLTQDTLTIQPSLPYPISHLQPPDFYFQGARLRAIMNSTHTSLTRLVSKNSTVIYDLYAGQSMPLTIGSQGGRRDPEFAMIAVDQTVTIANDMYWQTISTKDNLVQCQPTTSNSDNVLGSGPGAATDGNPTTKWQPLTTDKTNLTIEMTAIPFQQVKQLSFNWGARPPKKATVAFTNFTDITSFEDERLQGNIVQLDNIKPNQKYHLFDEADPTPHIGNTTIHNVDLPADLGGPVYTGKYAILEIEGCNECGSMNYWTGESGTVFNPQENTFGATVGEFEIVGMDGAIIGPGMGL